MASETVAKTAAIWLNVRPQVKVPPKRQEFMPMPTRATAAIWPSVRYKYTVVCVRPRVAVGSLRASVTVSPSADVSAMQYPRDATMSHMAKLPPWSDAAALHGSADLTLNEGESVIVRT